MQVCFPIVEDKGFQSQINAHFGSSPFYLLVDTGTKECRAIANGNGAHEHGMCHSNAALAGVRVDAFVVCGIGADALERLKSTGAKVLRSERTTVEVAVAALSGGLLQDAVAHKSCGGHGSSCGHK